MSNSLALDDLRILDLTRVLSGPICTQVFSDFGATVWKVENRTGDESRYYNKAGSAMVNRGKKSLVVDLADPRGQEIVRRLVAKADIAVENFRPGGLKRFGLDFQDLCTEFPTLIAASLSGFGQNGPLRSALGYDAIIQAATGQMVLNSSEGARENRIGIYVNDMMLGINAATAILIALHERARSGKGQHLDLSLYDAGMFSLLATVDTYLNGGEVPVNHGVKHPFKVPVQPFDTKDGRLMLGVGNDGQFQRLCQAMGLTELARDARYITNEGRCEHRAELEAILTAEFQRHPIQHWMDVFMAHKVPFAPVHDIPGAVSDEQATARRVVWEVETENGKGRVMANPLQHFSRTPPAIQRPPRLGEHTRQVLTEVLQMAPQDVAVLERDGVVSDASRFEEVA